VWRRNWLFGLIPAGLGLGCCIFLNVAGVQHEQELVVAIPKNEQGAAAPNHETLRQPVEQQMTQLAAHSEPRLWRVLFFVTLGIFTIVLLAAMQQRRQRRLVFLTLVLAASMIEIPYQVEEDLFRRDRATIRDYMEGLRDASGKYPAQERVRENQPRLLNRSSRISVNERAPGYHFFWNRPLNSGYSINFSSDQDAVWIQD
jgi:hypothetical protein